MPNTLTLRRVVGQFESVGGSSGLAGGVT